MSSALHLTDRDRASLEVTPREWRLASPCFKPNAHCLDQAARGLLEIQRDLEAMSPTYGRFRLRRTALADELLACMGVA